MPAETTPAVDLLALLASITPAEHEAAAEAYQAGYDAAHTPRTAGGYRIVKPDCRRCYGTGALPWYWRIEGGRCFDCTVGHS